MEKLYSPLNLSELTICLLATALQQSLTHLSACPPSDMIFSVAQLISFLSQSTTLLPGTLILTGTPAGVGFSATPQNFLQSGDEFSVELLPHVGTLTTCFVNE